MITYVTLSLILIGIHWPAFAIIRAKINKILCMLREHCSLLSDKFSLTKSLTDLTFFKSGQQPASFLAPTNILKFEFDYRAPLLFGARN